jgi:diguanylate cyclase
MRNVSFVKKNTARGFAVARRSYIPRCIGLSVGFAAVYFALPEHQTSSQGIAFLVVYCFGWPHIAILRALLSGAPAKAERSNLLFDAFAVGFFSGLIGINPLPSLAIITMVSMNSIAAGGPRLLAFGGLLTLTGLGLALVIFSPEILWATTPKQMNACVPLLVLYPLSLGYVCYLAATKLAQHKNELRILSTTDFLTGLKNRKAVNDLLTSYLDVGRAGSGADVVALIDVDHFKKINDQHGHLAGDSVLKHLGRIMLSCVREQDIVGRFGGDEFCVILRDVEPEQAKLILERIRATAELLGVSGMPELAMTLSIGASIYNDASLTVTKWLSRADTALYESKNDGRNRVTFANS